MRTKWNFIGLIENHASACSHFNRTGITRFYSARARDADRIRSMRCIGIQKTSESNSSKAGKTKLVVPFFRKSLSLSLSFSPPSLSLFLSNLFDFSRPTHNNMQLRAVCTYNYCSTFDTRNRHNFEPLFRNRTAPI